jgi:hypothetical protein
MNLARSLVIVIRVRARVGSSHPRDKYVLRENPVTDHEPITNHLNDLNGGECEISTKSRL